MDVQVFFNPACSKCRTVRGLLEDLGLEADYLHYLEQTPSREQLQRVMDLLRIDDPRDMMRVDEPDYRRLGLDSAEHDELLDAMMANPVLIQRPIIIHGDQAVIGRPPEKVLELFSSSRRATNP